MPISLSRLAASNAKSTDLALLLLRVFAGGMMAVGHGWGKLIKFGSDPSKFPDPLGIGGTPSFAGAIMGELVCCVLIAIGLFTRLACIPAIFTMGVAALVVHGKDPLFMGGGAAKEPALIYLAMFVVILIAGPGRWSLDRKIFARGGGG